MQRHRDVANPYRRKKDSRSVVKSPADAHGVGDDIRKQAWLSERFFPSLCRDGQPPYALAKKSGGARSVLWRWNDFHHILASSACRNQKKFSIGQLGGNLNIEAVD
jgi:hypothetical protein